MKITLYLLLLLLIFSPAHAQTTEKRICVDNPYRVWNTPISRAIAEFNRVVPSVWVATDCDIVIYVVDELPCAGEYFACTASGYPVQVYMQNGYAQMVSNLLHELMHAYGFWGHVNDIPSVTNEGFYSYKRLTAFDIATLQSMYSQ